VKSRDTYASSAMTNGCSAVQLTRVHEDGKGPHFGRAGNRMCKRQTTNNQRNDKRRGGERKGEETEWEGRMTGQESLAAAVL
jgi:hypothetical protein